MPWRGSTNKSPNYLNAAENKFDTGDLFTNEKNHRGKTLLGEFKVTTTQESSIINHKRLQVYGILSNPLAYPEIPTYNWTFILIPNWTCIVAVIFPFNAQISVRD